MVDDATKDLYDFSAGIDVLTNSMSDLERIMGDIRKSKWLTVFGRLTSGTENLWAMQNKIRAVAGIISLSLKESRPDAAKLKKSFEDMHKISKIAASMQPFTNKIAVKNKGFVEGLFGDTKFVKRDLGELQVLALTLMENVKDFEGIQHHVLGKGVDLNSRTELVELLEFTKHGLRGDYEGINRIEKEKQTLLDRRKKLNESLRKRQSGEFLGNFKKPDGSDSILNKILKAIYESPFGGKGWDKLTGREDSRSSIGTKGTPLDNLRVKLLQKQLIASEYVGKISKVFKLETWTNFAKFIGRGLWFFAKFMLGLTAILIGLILLKNVFEGFKEPLSKGFEAFNYVMEVAMTLLGFSIGLVADGIMDIKDALERGDIFLLLGGLLKVFSGVIVGTLVFFLGLIFGVLALTIVAVLERIAIGVSSGKEFGKLILDTLQVIGLIAGVLMALGSTLLSLPVLITLAITGAVAAALKKYLFGSVFSTGGIVNSNMQLVGEKGPELVSLPRGSRVHSNADSQRMGSSGGNTIHIHVSGRVGASDAEIRDIANKIGKEIKLKMMRSNNGVSFF
jgi:hypothetical protein